MLEKKCKVRHWQVRVRKAVRKYNKYNKSRYDEWSESSDNSKKQYSMTVCKNRQI